MAAKNARIPDWKEQRRWRALDLKRDGCTHQEVAEALDVTKGAVSRWMTRVASEGKGALCARPHLGATPRLTPDQMRLIPEFLSHGAEAYGFRGELWTCARAAEVIRREFGVSYHKDHVSRLLEALRWTPQKPAERAAQRDEAQIAAWRSETWPELKKSPARAAHLGLHRRVGLLPAARRGAHLRAVRRDAGAAAAPDARPPLCDERRDAAGAALHADAPLAAAKRRVHRLPRARAADGGRPTPRGVGRVAHPPQPGDQGVPRGRRGAVRPPGAAAGLRAGAEPGRGRVAAPQARGAAEPVLQRLGSSVC